MNPNRALRYIKLAETFDKFGDYNYSEVALSLAESF
jgi:hypothetical protein